MSSKKRLYRSVDDRMIAGVCGGLGEYFNIDPTLVRLALLFLVIWGGGGVLVYLIAWIVIPEAPAGYKPPAKADAEETGSSALPETPAEPTAPAAAADVDVEGSSAEES